MEDFICESPSDDGEVLRAVLAFLEEEGVDVEVAGDEPLIRSDTGSSAGGSSGSDIETPVELPSPSASSTSKRSSSSRRQGAAPRVFNRSRLRRRHEVLSLREQVVALEERLEALQKGGEASQHNDDENAKQLRVTAWQGIAAHQREQLTAAEQEREKLRQLIKEYKLAVKRVERFLNKQTFPTALLKADASSMPLRVISDPDTGDGFDEISRNLPAMYQQINGVFSDPRFQASVEGIWDMRLQNEDSLHMSVEVLDSRLLPFSVETTAQAVWHFHQIKSQKVTTTLDEQLEESDDLIRRTVIALLEIPNHKGTARGRIETRRFVEHGRVIILQYAVFDNTERISGYAPDGYGMRQFQWTVIGPPRDERLLRSGHVVSQIESFEVTLPFIENPSRGGSDAKKEQAALKQFVVESTNAIKDIERQTIENILLNLSLSERLQ